MVLGPGVVQCWPILLAQPEWQQKTPTLHHSVWGPTPANDMKMTCPRWGVQFSSRVGCAGSGRLVTRREGCGRGRSVGDPRRSATAAAAAVVSVSLSPPFPFPSFSPLFSFSFEQQHCQDHTRHSQKNDLEWKKRQSARPLLLSHVLAASNFWQAPTSQPKL